MTRYLWYNPSKDCVLTEDHGTIMMSAVEPRTEEDKDEFQQATANLPDSPDLEFPYPASITADEWVPLPVDCDADKGFSWDDLREAADNYCRGVYVFFEDTDMETGHGVALAGPTEIQVSGRFTKLVANGETQYLGCTYWWVNDLYDFRYRGAKAGDNVRSSHLPEGFSGCDDMEGHLEISGLTIEEAHKHLLSLGLLPGSNCWSST